MRLLRRLGLLAVVAALATAPAGNRPAAAPVKAKPYRLAPFKDELFAYPKVLASQYDGDYLVVEYSHQRDLVDRDLHERTEVRPDYVSLEVKAAQKDLVLNAGPLTVKYIGIGATDAPAKAIVIFLHGRGVGLQQGASDLMYGGNFNRLKNLMVRNGGVYLSAGFSDFRAKGVAEIKALVLDYAGRSPGAPVFLACASWGGNICWHLAVDPDTAGILGGLLFLDSSMYDGFIKIATETPGRKPLPILVSNGDEDRVLGWQKQERFFKKLKEAAPDYPIKFVLYRTGGHGTSLRMTDWRLILNWMLEASGR